ncbi:MAG: hypothetical protein DRJ97_01015 [Thermoprotei archaeon]|nr:MAG: hypothetical protein DRJ97_01015 [Thermoprotei archaeon]
MFRALNVMLASMKRFLKLDLKYRFELGVDALLLVANIVSFGILGHFVVSSNAELVNYPYYVFLLAGILYWTMIASGFNSGIIALREEAERGTIGFLLSNGVSPAVITLSRMMVSTLEALGISAAIALPAIYLLSGGAYPKPPSSPICLLEAAVAIALPWLFMASIAIALTAIQLMFKRIGGLAGAVHYALGVASGLYFPVQAVPLAGKILEGIPTTIGMSAMRELIVYGRIKALSLSSMLTPFTPAWSLLVTPLVALALSAAILLKIERLTMRWGTIEQY